MRRLLSDEAAAAIHGERNPGIGTQSGVIVDFENPGGSDLRAEDVAHGLANTCRFGGQCDPFYSVAEHAVFVADLLRAAGAGDELVLAGLHHDDAEAYIGDIPRPLKPHLGKPWADLEWAWDRAIEAVAGLDSGSTMAVAVKEADNFAVAYEAVRLIPIEQWGWPLPARRVLEALELPEGVEWRGGLSPRDAKALYLGYPQ
jgi:hypothetical protein